MSSETLRLAVISTPRCGNCWLRHMLATLYGLEQIIVHEPREVPWEALPERAILQLHWLPEEPFVSQLARHDFRVVVLARHPLDVLISILAFARHDDSTLRWLAGAGGDERSIAQARPLDEAFLAYAAGPRAERLLSVSRLWWRRAGVVRVYYRDLLRDAAGELARIAALLDAEPRRLPADVAAAATPDAMRAQNVHMLFHVWQATRYLWRSLLTAAAARRIHAAQREAFETYGFECDPDESLGAAEAELAWDRFDAAALKRHLHGVKHTLCELQARQRDESAGQQAELDGQRAELAAQQESLTRQQAILSRQVDEVHMLRAELAALRARVAELDGLGPWSVGAARRLQRVSRRFPRLAAAMKSAVTLARR